MVSKFRLKRRMLAASPATRSRGSRSPMLWRRANRSRLQPDQIKDSNAVATTGSGSWPMVRGDPEAVRVMASDTSDQRNQLESGRDRQCGEPRLSPLLICAKLATRPIRRSATLRRSKAFPSFVRLCLATASVVHFQERVQGRADPDAPTGVSDHRDFRSASHLGGYQTLIWSRRY